MMKKVLWQTAKVIPVVLGASFLATQGAMAASEDNVDVSQTQNLATPTQEVAPAAMPALATQADALELIRHRQNLKTFNAAPNGEQGMSQVTSVSELRDVQPTEWAYEALKSLVERYGCIVGYPDRTFRGNRALSRWEFAAGLNACMNVMERLLQENVAVIREDIDKLKALAQQFEQELAALGARVDNLEARTSYLEDHQFSTTTKLNANVIIAVTDQFGNDKALNWRQQTTFNNNQAAGRNPQKTPVDENTTLSDRVRLNFDTSFTGKDRLRTRLEAGDVPNMAGATGTSMARLGWDTTNYTGSLGSPTPNSVNVSKLFYRTPVAGNIVVHVGAVGLDLDDVFDVHNPYLSSSELGSLSRYGRFNPLLYRGPSGAGAAFQYKFSKELALTAAYLADSTNLSSSLGGSSRVGNPENGNGLFNGQFSTGTQLDWNITDTLGIGVAYLHSYFRGASAADYTSGQTIDLVNGTGSAVARDPFFGAPTVRDSYGASANWRISDGMNLSATGAYAYAYATGLDRNEVSRNGYGADLWTWNAALSFLDLGTQGAVLSIGGGLMPYAPTVTNRPGDPINNDRNAPYQIETQYRYPVAKNITLTPGFYVIFNPEANGNNSSIWVGTLRTTFVF
ncbi:MAG: iron uptake porin [Woronichinia naegeliana WA131]|uniref:Iron uptake porin n=1 Tax=Woronichinia naegeliana WA131 TaxID=2824559 RepID=A0A977KWB2_9CYAN|nr:MAG: iron uptake porin [Woronichinia naegeliana WA131]